MAHTTTVDDLPSGPPPGAGVLGPLATSVLASASATAGIIHFAMLPAHAADSVAMGVGFAVVAWFQVIGAVLVVVRPSRRLLVTLAAGNLAVVAMWAVSRTVGLPIGSHAGEAEAVALADLVATAAAGLVALVAAASLRVRDPQRDAALSAGAAVAVPVIAAMVLTTAALAAPGGDHEHGDDDGHDHDLATSEGHAHGEEVALVAGSEHDHAEGDAAAHEAEAHDHDSEVEVAAAADEDDGHDHAATATKTTAGATSGHDHGASADHGDGTTATTEHLHDEAAAPDTHEHDPAAPDPHDHGDLGPGHHDCAAPVTAAQQSWGDAFAAATDAATVRFEDLDVALAEGYVPITPESSQIVHYGRYDLMEDGILLDPQRIESLMYGRGPDGRMWFLGAMYWNDNPGVAEPTPGGCLTQWHTHTNLCIAPERGMVGVVAPDGTCPPGSVNEETSSMMHVWTIPLPSGPFTHDAAPDDIRTGVQQKFL